MPQPCPQLISATGTQVQPRHPHLAHTTPLPRRLCGTQEAPTISAVGWLWLVSLNVISRHGWRPLVAAWTPSAQSLPYPTPTLCLGMPTAYDLSSVIAGGSSVGHNNLIPLGECPLGSVAWQGRTGMCQWPGQPVLGPLPPLSLSWSLPALPGDSSPVCLSSSTHHCSTCPSHTIHEKWNGPGRLGAVTSPSLPLSSLSLRSQHRDCQSHPLPDGLHNEHGHCPR